MIIKHIGRNIILFGHFDMKKSLFMQYYQIRKPKTRRSHQGQFIDYQFFPHNTH